MGWFAQWMRGKQWIMFLFSLVRYSALSLTIASKLRMYSLKIWRQIENIQPRKKYGHWKLDELPGSEGSDQWSKVHWSPVTSSEHQRWISESVLNIFINDLDWGTGYILSVFANESQLGGEVIHQMGVPPWQAEELGKKESYKGQQKEMWPESSFAELDLGYW